MSVKPLAILLVGLSLLAGGAGWSDIPFIGYLAIPVALVGAFMVGSAAFALKNPQGSAVRRGVGDVLLLIGTIALHLINQAGGGAVSSHILGLVIAVGIHAAILLHVRRTLVALQRARAAGAA